ncbi:IclR family transcriptional regulator C-terminal domain-containing protein [Frankia sp. QA3]|uniref:IclR family transcriptional regulator domain-containing protein n=1 Tax=Frankia sp. QA3 TaxID=710111 RepID=UPI0002E462CE|nr:IclR family transcriptional regulator C-terminal domain-containing protein [Frankia sp. QA3]
MRTMHLREHLLPHLLELHRLTDEAVHLGVLRDQGVLCVERLHGHRSAPLPVQVGGILPVHATALGKVLLAFADEALGDRADQLVRSTNRTILASRALDGELEDVRSLGFAVDRGEFRPNIGCLAAPVCGPVHHRAGRRPLTSFLSVVC